MRVVFSCVCVCNSWTLVCLELLQPARAWIYQVLLSNCCPRSDWYLVKKWKMWLKWNVDKNWAFFSVDHNPGNEAGFFTIQMVTAQLWRCGFTGEVVCMCRWQPQSSSSETRTCTTLHAPWTSMDGNATRSWERSPWTDGTDLGAEWVDHSVLCSWKLCSELAMNPDISHPILELKTCRDYFMCCWLLNSKRRIKRKIFDCVSYCKVSLHCILHGLGVNFTAPLLCNRVCERCQNNVERPLWRYLLSLTLKDQTGQQIVTAFGEQGQEILGMSADSLKELEGTPDFDKVVVVGPRICDRPPVSNASIVWGPAMNTLDNPAYCYPEYCFWQLGKTRVNTVSLHSLKIFAL